MLKIYKNSLDLSLKLQNFVTESFMEDFIMGDSLYVGYYKPINSLFIEIDSHTTENNLVTEYWNGSTWDALDVKDRTFGLKKSGFVTWERNISDQAKTTIFSNELYWYKFSIDSNDILDFKIYGINLVFSDDSDLLESYPDIMGYLPEGKNSFIGYHQSARNYILTYLRNKGKTIKARDQYKMIDQFDLHDHEEVRQASKYKALAMIFYNESDQIEDKWYQKARDFDRLYGESIDLNFLSIDENDDGQIEASEKQSIQYIRIQRL
jgi:hypothetical protein